jgi:hypothetical protein
LYTVVLNAALNDPDRHTRAREDSKRVLDTIICAQEPLTVGALSELLRMRDAGRVRAALQPLWSVLHIAQPGELVTTLHASFPDYMLDSTRSAQYHLDIEKCHHSLALGCFDCIKATQPQFNICGLESSYIRDEEVSDLEQRVKQAISSEMYYSCRYWATHLEHAEGTSDMVERLDDFLSMRLLLWMEVLNLKGCMNIGAQMIAKAEGWGSVGSFND